ncbi:MAG: putative signal transducing protein [Chitinophagaceae bacterium]
MNNRTDWICIQKTSSRFEAEAMRGNLEHAGFNCVVLNKQDSAYISIGYFELHVPQQEAEAAQTYLAKREENNTPDGL